MCLDRGEASPALAAEEAGAGRYGLSGGPTLFLHAVELPLSELPNLPHVLREAVAAAQ